jgi:hypothetical protein
VAGRDASSDSHQCSKEFEFLKKRLRLELESHGPQAKHKVFWKAVQVASHLLAERNRFHPIEFREVAIQHHIVAANHMNAALNDPHGNG